MKILIILCCLIISINAIKITCEFRDEIFNGWQKRYTCRTIKYLNEGHDKSVESLSGVHTNASSNLNVTQYFAKGIKIEQFPEGLGSHFNNLEVIRMISCDMTILYKSSLRNLRKLKFLDLHGNRLENLDSGTFEDTPLLIEVWITNNRLQFIGANLFRPLKDLKILNLGGNTCIGSNARHSDEDLERLKIEMRLKCSDVSMFDLLSKITDMEDKFEVLLKIIDKLQENLVESKKIYQAFEFEERK